MTVQLPESYLRQMRHMLGETYGQFIESYSKPRTYGLRLNTQKISIRSNAFTLIQSLFDLEPIPWCPTGYYFDGDVRPGRHPYHSAGVYYIQEPSAMSAAELLAPQPGELVLDLAAAPGGKSTLIANLMQGRGLLICNEIHAARAAILSENIERMGIRHAVVTNATPGQLAERFPALFDRIMVDAPCSGEGMFRKEPETVSEWSEQQVLTCATRQKDILHDAVKMLKPGGTLAYSTCTFNHSENEEVIHWLVETYPALMCVQMERFWPHEQRGEGHFVALLKHRGDAPAQAYIEARAEADVDAYSADSADAADAHNMADDQSVDISGAYGAVAADAQVVDVAGAHGSALFKKSSKGKRKEKGFTSTKKSTAKHDSLRTVEAAMQLYEAFAAEWLRQPLQLPAGEPLLFGEQLYWLPSGGGRLSIADLAGLKTPRPGLHLGTVRKGRFEPSHALALTLDPQAVKLVHDVVADSAEATAYLRGETLFADPADRLHGWTLVTVDGFAVGWGKASNGMIKNHYPKGLRRPY